MNDQHTQASQNQQYRAEWLPGLRNPADYALCDSDATNIVHIAGTYDLPFGHGRAFMANANRAVDAILGGWIINGFYTHQSGQPFTINCPVATTADFGCFANVVPGQGLYTGGRTVAQWLNPKRFCGAAHGDCNRPNRLQSRSVAARSRRADRTSATWIRRS